MNVLEISIIKSKNGLTKAELSLYAIVQNQSERKQIMFFIMGVTPQTRQITYNGELIICPECGKYGRYEVFMTCMCLSLFFIPTFKWGRQYFVKSNCCNAAYQLDPAIGREIARGADIQILPEHLTKVSNGNVGDGNERTYTHCGFKTSEDFQYCPKCGRPL